VSVVHRRHGSSAIGKEPFMNPDTAFQAQQRDRYPQLSKQDLRVRALGGTAAIAVLAALVFAAVALAGCDAVEPAGASSAAQIAPEAAPQAAGEKTDAPASTPSAWRTSPNVTYTPEDWRAGPDSLPTF
jgi:hypothetical protein